MSKDKPASDKPRESGPGDQHDDVTSLSSEFEAGAEADDAEDELKMPGYQVLRQLGSGGMGTVFLARQVEPVDRQVAIKLIQRRIRNPAAEVHFLIERQALAQMQHPASKIWAIAGCCICARAWRSPRSSRPAPTPTASPTSPWNTCPASPCWRSATHTSLISTRD